MHSSSAAIDPVGDRIPVSVDSPQAHAFRVEARDLIASELSPLVDEAECRRRFPAAAIEALGAAGIVRRRWSGGSAGEPVLGVILAEELGRAGLGGIGIGVSVHVEAALSVLTRFGRGAAVAGVVEDALAGKSIACVAISEDAAGSDLASVDTTAMRTDEGWRVRGTKAYVSLGAVADLVLVLVRVHEDARRLALPSALGVVLVPREGLTVERRLTPVGVRGLETVRLGVNATVPGHHMLGRAGKGMLVGTWGLSHERQATAAFVLGTAQLAITIAATHLHRRTQFGARLLDHQALRLRLADLQCQVSIARDALYARARLAAERPGELAHAAAGLKVTVARLGERVASECLHMLGARGYLEEESSMSRLWRDLRLARLGGGTDEMMWELTSRRLPHDDDTYDAWVGSAG